MIGVSLALAWTASAAEPIRLDDVSGTAGAWQEGTTVVDAPIEEVRAWLLDFAGWPRRFPDVVSAQVLKHTSPNVWIVRFRSRILGGDLTVRWRASPNEVVYRSADPIGPVAGRILLEALDARHTHVTMQTSSRALLPPPAKLKRKRAFAKLQADLTALQALAAELREHM
jgi:hypothetical protein